MQHIRAFFAKDYAPALVMLVAAVAAMAAANGPIAGIYQSFLETRLTFGAGDAMISKPVQTWVNDGLMAVFFLLVGLELKREFLTGHLADRSQAALPLFGALGGIVVPVAIFAAINWHSPETLAGWAIPAATDIVFALAILTLFGRRVPMELKVFLLALAVIDDIAAILFIALFYTDSLGLIPLAGATATLAVLAVLNRVGVRSLTPYLLGGLVLWGFVLGSGVHATLAGVLLAFTIPLRVKGATKKSPARVLEHSLHGLSSFLILPVFAFANAGVGLGQIGLEQFLAPLPLGIVAGLLIGKQVGVFTFAFAATRLKLCRLPDGVSWPSLYGVAVLTGIGFTMSLFIGALAFEAAATLTPVRGAIMVASALSAILGYLVLNAALPKLGRRANTAISVKGGMGNATV